MTLQPWQERVVEEKEQLAERLNKLNAFLGSEMALGLPFDERCLLVRQASVMKQYLDVLLDRIARLFETATTKGE